MIFIQKSNRLDNVVLSTILFHLKILRDLALPEVIECIDC